MDLIDQLRTIADRASDQGHTLLTEEATKNALIMPFINALGYNVFDPTEVVPEYTADVGIRRGEKVDYVIMRDGSPAILMECKAVGKPLGTDVISQLFRYFTSTDARFGVITDGIKYRFFSDLEKPNRMDEKPFLEFDLLNLRPEEADQIRKFTKSEFDQEAILSSASELKYIYEIRRALAKQLDDPDEDFVRLMTSRATDARFSRSVHDRFDPLVRDAFRGFIKDQVHERLQAALEGTAPVDRSDAESRVGGEPEADDDLVTTAEELEAFFIVKSILREQVAPDRIVPRDVRSYFGVLLDNNNRKPLARLHMNGGVKHLGLFDNAEKREDRVRLDCLDDIYMYRDRLLATPAFYQGEDTEPEPEV